MRLILDTVQGHEADLGVYNGRVIRTGLITGLPIASGVTNPMAMLSALSGLGMPQRGDRFPHPDYHDFFVKRHILRAIAATQAIVQIVYEYHGLLVIQDTSTLTSQSTQLHPKDFSPLYVKWKNPNGGANAAQVIRIANFNTLLPLRHVIASQTIDHQASDSVLLSFGSVNDRPWYGLPAGYWLFSGLEGLSDDNGITYSYRVTISTKQREDWSQVEYLRDDRGVSVIVPEANVRTLRNTPYAYSQDSSVNGLLKVGLFPMVNFYNLFGFGG